MTEVFMEEKKSGRRFTEEFKVEAVRQVTERGHPVAEVAARLGVSTLNRPGFCGGSNT
jgi:transposase